MAQVNSLSLFGGGNSYSNPIKNKAPEEQGFFSKAPLNFHAKSEYNSRIDDTGSKKSKNDYLDMYM